jgi:hypothetical protein
MTTRFDARCSQCKRALYAGTDVHYDRDTKMVTCWECHDNPKPTTEALILAQSLGFLPYEVACIYTWGQTVQPTGPQKEQ